MTTPPTSDPDSDEHLLVRTAAGDSQAFTLLFRRRQGQVYRFALHMTGSAAVADDVTQEVFMVVIRDADRYQPGRSGVGAWLCGIARNCALQRLDRERPFLPLEPLENEDEASIEQSPQVDPLGELTRAEGIERVRRGVLSLPVRYREVIVLCDLQELSYTEAAEVLACAVGTVRSRLHRGRLLLGDKLSIADRVSEAPVAAAESESGRPRECAASPQSGRVARARLRGSRTLA